MVVPSAISTNLHEGHTQQRKESDDFSCREEGCIFHRAYVQHQRYLDDEFSCLQKELKLQTALSAPAHVPNREALPLKRQAHDTANTTMSAGMSTLHQAGAKLNGTLLSILTGETAHGAGNMSLVVPGLVSSSGNRSGNVVKGVEVVAGNNPEAKAPCRADNKTSDAPKHVMSRNSFAETWSSVIPWGTDDQSNSTSKQLDLDVLDEPIEIIESKHILARFFVAPISLVFVLIFTVVTLIERFELTFVPEPAIMIFFGIGLAYFLERDAHLDIFGEPEEFGAMTYSVLNLLLLPIIIFASGWTLRRQDFFSQFPYILLFAIVGVVMSVIIMGPLIYLTGRMGFHCIKTLRTSFAYAILLSPTDTVAVLAFYSKLRVDPLLNILVYGESTLNDAVAIVLFNVINSDTFLVGDDGQTLGNLQLCLKVVFGVCKIFLGSAGIGIGTAILYAFIAGAASMHRNKKGQVLVTFCSCYLTYGLAESCAMSGIIANLFCGIISGIYIKPHLFKEGSLLATFFLEQAARLADCAVFILVGVCVVRLADGDWSLAFFILPICLIGRFFSVFPLGALTNTLKEMLGTARGIPRSGWHLLSHSHMFMIWYAGLRGAVCLALCLELGSWVDAENGAHVRRYMQTAAFVVICVFLFLFGGSTVPMLKALNIPMGVDYAPDVLSKTEADGPMRSCLIWLDDNIISPVLLGDFSHSCKRSDGDALHVLTTSFSEDTLVEPKENDSPMLRGDLPRGFYDTMADDFDLTPGASFRSSPRTFGKA